MTALTTNNDDSRRADTLARAGVGCNSNLFAVYPGQRFQGRGQFTGMQVHVLDVQAGMATCLISGAPSEGVQRTANWYRKCGQSQTADDIIRAASAPRKELRELEWFRQWLRAGLLVEVRHG